MKNVPYSFLIYTFLASLVALAFSPWSHPSQNTAPGRGFLFSFPNWKNTSYQTQNNRKIKSLQHTRELQQGRQLPSGSSCSGAIPSPWIPLQVWLRNPRKLQFRSVHSASFCSGQRKDKPFSSALLLPVDEAEPAGTAKISVFTTHTVL